MITCKHYSREHGNKRHGLCALGWYGGTPLAGQCVHQCLVKGLNTQEARDADIAAEARQFPESAKKNVRPCC